MDVMTDQEQKIVDEGQQEQKPTEGSQDIPALQFSPEWIVNVVSLLKSVGDTTVTADTLHVAIATQRNLMVLINSLNTILNSLSQRITTYADGVAGWERDEDGSLKIKEAQKAEPSEAKQAE